MDAFEGMAAREGGDLTCADERLQWGRRIREKLDRRHKTI